MNNFKKVISVLSTTAFIVGLSMPVFASPFADVSDSAPYASSVSRLAGLGIMQGNGTTFNPDTNITRAEVTKVIEVEMGYGKVATATTTQFADVSKTKWYFGAVNFAANMGMVKGYVQNGKKVFGPENNVTYGELLTIMVRALGYKDADLQGTWPLNYMAKAAEIGLLDNVDVVDASAPAKRSDVALIADTMLGVQTKAQVDKASTLTLFDAVKTKLGVSAVSGIITNTSLVDSTLPANTVVINNTNYTVGDSDVNAFMNNNLGMNVTAYADKSGKIILVTGETGTGMNVTASQDGANSTIKYLDASNVEQTLAVNATPKVFVNGKAATGLAAIKSGASVRLVNTDPSTTDTDYDYVVATQYQAPVIVGSNITSDDVATVKTVGAINLLKSDNTAATVTVTGAATKLSQIQANDVVQAAASQDNSLIKLVVTRNAVPGQVIGTTVDTSGKMATITVGGKAYNVASNMANGQIAIGDTKTFLLDKDNNVVGAIANANTQAISLPNYGVVTGSGSDAWGTNQIRVATTDGQTKIMNTAALVNAANFTNKLAYYSVDSTTNLATVTAANSGAINSINIVPTTAIFAIRTDGAGNFVKIERVNASDISITNGANGFYVADPTSTMGDYAIVAYVDPQATNTQYGYVAGKTGTVLNGTSTNDQYSIFVNGALQLVNANQGLNLSAGDIISAYSVTGGVATAFTKVDQTNANVYKTGTVQAIDSSRVKLNGDATVYTLDSNVKVYNIANSTVKADTLGNVTTDMANAAHLVIDSSSGTAKVIMIVINK